MTALPAFHRAVVLPLETMLLSEFCRDCSFITGSAGGAEEEPQMELKSVKQQQQQQKNVPVCKSQQMNNS